MVRPVIRGREDNGLGVPLTYVDPEAHLDRIPEPGASLERICEFALTFDGHDYFCGDEQGAASRCADIGHRVRSRFLRASRLPDDLVSLRTALFFARQQLASGEADDGYMAALVERIREVAVAGGLLQPEAPSGVPPF